MRRVPTEKQYRLLSILGGGAIALAPGRRDWSPLLRRGWVEPVSEDDHLRYLPPLRITPTGLRALADAIEHYGTPELEDPPKQVNEPPSVTRLKGDLARVRSERDEARHEARASRVALDRVRRAVEATPSA